jgi:hypothetical protein
MINSRVALQVVTAGSIDIAGAYPLVDLLLNLMQTNCRGEHRLGRSGERPRLQPDLAGGKLRE